MYSWLSLLADQSCWPEVPACRWPGLRLVKFNESPNKVNQAKVRLSPRQSGSGPWSTLIWVDIAMYVVFLPGGGWGVEGIIYCRHHASQGQYIVRIKRNHKLPMKHCHEEDCVMSDCLTPRMRLIRPLARISQDHLTIVLLNGQEQCRLNADFLNVL